MKKFNQPDLDCDLNENAIDFIKKNMKCIQASILNEKGINPHNSGVYFCDVPVDLISNLCSINYKEAEENFGYIKLDLLHNIQYDKFKNRTELLNVLSKPIKWELLNDEHFVETLPHIGSYYQFIQSMPKIDSIEKLAMLISVIRPGKKYLIDKVKRDGWLSIQDEIWKPTEEYYYKKSHAISYAMMISINMR